MARSSRRAKTKSGETGFRRQAQKAARRERAIQRKIDRLDARRGKPGNKNDGMQAGARRYPEPKLSGQHLSKPGREADLELKPMYEAPYYQGSDKLRDMVAIVTGGDSGIGRAVATLFAREGADVAVAYLNEDQDAKKTKRSVENEGRRCILLPGDVADPAYCRDAVKKTINAFGKLDILVNNAAFQEHAEKLEDISDEHFDRTIKTNLYGYFNMAKAAIPKMKTGGSIVMTGSVTGLLGNKHLLDYSLTKGGIHAFARSLGSRTRRSWHSRQRGRTGAGMDPAQSGRQAGKGRRKVRRRYADAAAGAAGRDCTCVCVSRRSKLFQLHHRRDFADHRGLFGRLREI